MKRSFCFTVGIFLILSLANFQVSAQKSSAENQAGGDFKRLIQKLWDNPKTRPHLLAFQRLSASQDWYEDLANPVVTSQEELDQKISECRKVYYLFNGLADYLRKQEGFLTEQGDSLLEMTEFITQFFSNDSTFSPVSQVRYVDFSTSQAPAVKALREEVSLPPPAGPAFIRYFRSREEMPPIIRQCFEEKTRGVTVYCRYIAVLAEAPTFDKPGVNKALLNKTVNHEYVHAYLNSTLGMRNKTKLPLWFHEGCAIYFSKSGGTHVDVTSNADGYLYRTYEDTEDYRRYRLVFKYLAKEHDRDKFCALIKESILTQSAAPLLQGTGFSSYEALADKVSRTFWQRHKRAIIISLIVMFIIFAVWLR
ncbi:MAG: hypothetical protein ABIH38_05440 [Patescibacteria group bacterium]